MCKFLIVQNNTILIFPTFIEARTGIAALEKNMPDHLIGRIKRIRAWDKPDYILRKVSEVSGKTSVGPAIGYKYHKPTITRQ